MNTEKTRELVTEAVGGEEIPSEDVGCDQDGPIAYAKRKRATAKGVMTRHMGVIKKLTTDAKNIAQVKEKMDAYSKSVTVFETVHHELLELLQDKDQREEARVYSDEVMTQHMDFQGALYNWIALQEDEANNEHQEDDEIIDDARLESVVPEKRQLAFTEILDACLEAKNKNLGEEIKELSRKQQLEMQNCQLSLQKEKQIFELQKAILESELMLKRERQ